MAPAQLERLRKRESAESLLPSLATPRREIARMLRCSRKDTRHPPSCTCLVDAFRNYPAQTDFGKGCAMPACPIRSLDSITLQQFLDAIGRPDGFGEDEIEQAERAGDIPISRAMVRRRKR